MNKLLRYLRGYLKGLLAGILLLPALASAHVATDIPIARQLHCYIQPGFWSGNTPDAGCNELYKVSGTYPSQQWNEVAKLIKAKDGYDYNDQATVEQMVPDGKLCAAGDPQKAGLDQPSANWHKTPMAPKNGFIEVRVSGTAPHVSSLVKIYLSKPGYNPTAASLRWSDLDLVHQETVTVARTDWGNQPPLVAGMQGFFTFNVAIPPGRTGDAVLFTRFQRIDPDGEGFYNCSDITLLNGGPTPTPEWHANGLYQPPGFNPVPNDKIHFRVLGSSKSYKEVVDLEQLVNSPDPKIWGSELLQALAPYKSIVQIGELKGTNVVYNNTQLGKNQVYLADEQASKAMSIIKGDNPGPVNPGAPVARITGPKTLTTGQTYTFDGQGSTSSNGRLEYQWAPPLITTDLNKSTVTGNAYVVKQPTKATVRLNVLDPRNNKTAQAELEVEILPANGGGDYPDYKEGTAYKAGDIVTNNGKNYKCKPHPYTAWCAGAGWAYAPGSGTAWQQAWDEVK